MNKNHREYKSILFFLLNPYPLFLEICESGEIAANSQATGQQTDLMCNQRFPTRTSSYKHCNKGDILQQFYISVDKLSCTHWVLIDLIFKVSLWLWIALQQPYDGRVALSALYELFEGKFPVLVSVHLSEYFVGSLLWRWLVLWHLHHGPDHFVNSLETFIQHN